MKAIVWDRSKFEKRNLNFILNKKNLGKLTKLLYEKGCVTKSAHLKICSSASKPHIRYGQAKVPKPGKDNCGSFCPILLAIDTRSYS